MMEWFPLKLKWVKSLTAWYSEKLEVIVNSCEYKGWLGLETSMLKSPTIKKFENKDTCKLDNVENKQSKTPCELGGLYKRQTQNLHERNPKDTMMHSKVWLPTKIVL